MSDHSSIATFRSVWIFAALSACMAAGYGVLFTVVADFRDAYGISETAIGLVIGVGFLSAFVAQVLIAPLADRGHARTLVVVGVLINVVGLLMMGFGTSLGPILLGRIVSGIGIGGASPAIRRIVILADGDNVGRNLGSMVSADVFGFAIGPAVSAVLVGPFGLPSPFIVVSAATLALMVPALRRPVVETVEPERRRLALDLLAHRAVAGPVVLAAAAFLMIGTFDALWDVVHDDLGTAPWVANLGITLFALPLVVLSPIGGKLAERVGPVIVAAAGLVAGASFMFAYGLLPTGTWIFSVAMVHALTDGLTIAAPGVAVSMAVPEHRQAGAQGVLGAAQALSGGVSAIVIGAVYDGGGRFPAYAAGAAGMLVLVVIGVMLAGFGSRRRSVSAAEPAATVVAGS